MSGNRALQLLPSFTGILASALLLMRGGLPCGGLRQSREASQAGPWTRKVVAVQLNCARQYRWRGGEGEREGRRRERRRRESGAEHDRRADSS